MLAIMPTKILEIMRKKVFAVFAVMLFMSASSLNTTKNPYDCFDEADILANDVACEVEEITGVSTSYSEWYDTWVIFYDACMNR